jgi:nucleoside-diphosphate-sugar epimerase
MKALFIGGTGTISTEISKLCIQQGWELTLLNRGNASSRVPEGARVLCVEGTLGQDGRFEKVFVGRVGGACNGVCGRMYR